MDIKEINVSSSDLGSEELAAISQVFESGYLGMGKKTNEFEQSLSEYLSREVVCVSTGTAALQLALEGCGVGPGDEVIVPSLTYVATFQAICATGGSPVAVDVLENTLTIDPNEVIKNINKKTKAILPVHYAAASENIFEIYKIAGDFGLRVIEDAAHAFGGDTYQGKVGSYGDTLCFSFDPIKNITSGDGGCVVSSNQDTLNYVRDARLLGVKNDYQSRLQEKRLYEFELIKGNGWRYHLNNINSAIGICQLNKSKEFFEKRRVIAKIYDTYFKNCKDISVLDFNYNRVVPHIYVILLKDKVVRDHVKNELKSKLNVNTALHWYPNHLHTKYQNRNSFKVTNSIYERVLTIPLHTRLKLEDVHKIGKFITKLIIQK